MTSQIDHHVDKYNDPRVSISLRGILLGLFVFVFAIGGAALSIWARRTRLEKTTEFWGPEIILAFQLAEEIELIPDPQGETSETEPVRLTGMPGLGHLRHAFLDERSYDWESAEDQSIDSKADDVEVMCLRFTDPTAHRFPDTQILVDMQQGWVGVDDGNRRVRLNERFRDAMPNFLKQIADFEPMRVENREARRAAQE